MSEACECDRCGAFYSDGTSGILHHKEVEGATRRYSYHTEGNVYDDLCAECYEKLLKFLDGRDLQPKPIGFALGESMLKTFEVTMTLGETKPSLPDYMESETSTNY